jgi:hypothetical protein
MNCIPADHVFVEETCEACGVHYYDVPERVKADDAIYNPELLP